MLPYSSCYDRMMSVEAPCAVLLASKVIGLPDGDNVVDQDRDDDGASDWHPSTRKT